jgi:hypothetical protein
MKLGIQLGIFEGIVLGLFEGHMDGEPLGMNVG